MIVGFARKALVGACSMLGLLALAQPAAAEQPTLTADARPGARAHVAPTYEVTLPASLDVGLLVGQSLSMMHVKNALAGSSERFVDELRAASPDAEISVASFVDFPVPPHGSPERSDYPFRLGGFGITTRAGYLQQLARLSEGSGLDDRDSQLFALAHAASGRPATWLASDGGTAEIARVAPTAERFGGMQYRTTGAAHVTLLISHAPFHTLASYANGEGWRIQGVPSFFETTDEMNAAGVRFAGVAFGRAGETDPGEGFDALAVGTGTPLTSEHPRGYVVADAERPLADDMLDALRRVAWKVEPRLESCDRPGVTFAASPATSDPLPSGSDAAFAIALDVPADVPSGTTIGCTIAYAVGGIVSARQTAEITVDADAPVTTASFDAGWRATPAPVTLTASDAGGSGVAATYYELGETPATPTTSSPRYDPLHPPTLAHGERISFFSVDGAGNVESVRTSSNAAHVDVTAPSTLWYPWAADEDQWLGAPPRVSLVPSDWESGVARTHYEIGSPPATPTTASPEYDWLDRPTLRHGESIAFFSVDAAGNAETVRTSWVAKVDTTPPTTEASFDTARRTTPAPVTLTARDGDGSGVARTHYEIGASPTTPTTTSPVYDPAHPPVLGDGERIAFFSVDEVGNAEAPQRSADAARVGDDDPVVPSPVDPPASPLPLPAPPFPLPAPPLLVPAPPFGDPPVATPTTVTADLSSARDGLGRQPFVLAGRSASVGCRASAGAIAGCSVRAVTLRRLTTPAGAVLPTGTVLATGTSASNASPARVLASTLTLTPAGRRAFARRPLGVTARLELTSRTEGGTVLVGRSRVRLMRDDQLVLRVPGRAVALPKASRILLDRLARTLTAARTVRCAADTDDRGTARGDRALTRRQATAACRFLRARGLRATVEVVGHGHHRPRASNETRAGRALNRRLTITTTF